MYSTTLHWLLTLYSHDLSHSIVMIYPKDFSDYDVFFIPMIYDTIIKMYLLSSEKSQSSLS